MAFFIKLRRKVCLSAQYWHYDAQTLASICKERQASFRITL